MVATVHSCVCSVRFVRTTRQFFLGFSYLNLSSMLSPRLITQLSSRVKSQDETSSLNREPEAEASGPPESGSIHPAVAEVRPPTHFLASLRSERRVALPRGATPCTLGSENDDRSSRSAKCSAPALRRAGTEQRASEARRQ